MSTSEYRAYHIDAGKGIDTLKISTHPIPHPQRGELLIKVHATSLNYRDYMIASGKYPAKCVPDLIPLSDGAGEVVEVAPDVTEFKVGDRVVGIFLPRYQGGDFTREKGSLALGGSAHGMLAEYVVLEASGVVPIPQHLSYEEAATLPCAGVTAWHALMDCHRPVGPDQTVLTLGTGGVSLFAAQFAAAAGATVIITSSSDDKIEKCLKLGAKHAVNYKKHPQWSEEVNKLTAGNGVDHVIELGGSGTFEQSFSSVAYSGLVHEIGFLAPPGKADSMARILVFKGCHLRGLYVGSRDHFIAMNKAITQHQIRPVIDKVFPFNQAKEAYHYLEQQKHIGKIVIKVTP